MRINESSRASWFYPLIYLGMQNGCLIKMDIFWYTCVWKRIWRWNKYNNSMGIQCWCSKLCCSLLKYLVLCITINWKIMERVGWWGVGGHSFLFCTLLPIGTRWYSFSVIRYPGMASLWNTISRIKCFLTHGNISSSLM